MLRNMSLCAIILVIFCATHGYGNVYYIYKTSSYGPVTVYEKLPAGMVISIGNITLDKEQYTYRSEHIAFVVSASSFTKEKWGVKYLPKDENRTGLFEYTSHGIVFKNDKGNHIGTIEHTNVAGLLTAKIRTDNLLAKPSFDNANLCRENNINPPDQNKKNEQS